MKKLISIIITAAICAAIAAPVTAASDKLTAKDVKELLCANGLQNHPDLLERDAVIQNPFINGWERDVYKLKDLVDTSFSYKGCSIHADYCENRTIDLDNDLSDTQIDFVVLDKTGRIARVSVFSDDYGIEQYKGKVYFDDLPRDEVEPYSDDSYSFFDVDGKAYGFREIAEIINKANIGKVDTIAAASMTIYIHSDKGEYVIPCDRSYDLSAAYLGREEMSYEKGVLIPFEEYERVCVNIDKNDRDDPRDFKYAVDKTVIKEENEYSLSGSVIRDTDTRAAYIGTESVFSDVEGDLVSYVNELSDLGIINGYEDGSFRPDGTISRAEAAAMIGRMLHYSAEYDGGFSDVPFDAWYAPELAALAECGIINGTGGNEFSPEDSIRYVDLLKIIEGILGYNAQLSAEDYEEIVIDRAMELGLTSGVGSFEITAPARRGNIAVILSNALDTHIQTAITTVKGENSGYAFTIGQSVTDITLIDYINGGTLNGELQ